MANERNSILASRGNQNSTTLLRHLDTKDHKEVLRHFKSDKKAGTTQLHSALKVLDDSGKQFLFADVVLRGFLFWGLTRFTFGQGNGLPEKGTSFSGDLVFADGCLDRL